MSPAQIDNVETIISDLLQHLDRNQKFFKESPDHLRKWANSPEMQLSNLKSIRAFMSVKKFNVIRSVELIDELVDTVETEMREAQKQREASYESLGF